MSYIDVEKIVKEINKSELKRSEVFGVLLASLPESDQLIKALLLIEQHIENWTVSQKDHQGKVSTRHLINVASRLTQNSLLVDFIADNIHLAEDSDTVHGLCELVFGNFGAFLKLKRSKALPSPDSGDDSIFHSLYDETKKWINPPFQQRCGIDVFTSGVNDQMSLGNPLGTSKRKKLHFEDSAPETNNFCQFRVKSVVIGAATTIFLGEFKEPGDGLTAAGPRNTFFVSGKFGTQHFMTPHPISLDADDEPICAAIANAHQIICCKKSFFVIGDNSRNQLGCGPSTQSVKQLRRLSLMDQLSEKNNQIQNCWTSNNHTILSTECGFLVAGTNVGQMGDYAMRAFNQRLGPPKGFTRLLAPHDSLNNQRLAEAVLADDITVLFVGSKVRVFFEYHPDMNFKVNVDTQPEVHHHIVSVAICKPNIFGASTCLLIFTSNSELYFWKKSFRNQNVMEPIWRLETPALQHALSSQQPSELSLNLPVSFTCSQDGEFLVIRDHIVYAGNLSGSLESLKVDVRRLRDSPGYVEKAFMSSTGKNVAFLVKRNVRHVADDSKTNRMLQRRLQLLERIQNAPAGNGIVDVVARSRKFKAHAFMLRIRAPNILRRSTANGRQIDLREYNDSTVRELLEFIYTNTSKTFRVLESDPTEHMIRHLVDGTCHICRCDDPWLFFGLSAQAANRRCGMKRFSRDQLRSALTDATPISARAHQTSLSEAVEKQLNRLCILARDIQFVQLQKYASKVLEQLPNTIVTSSKQPFIPRGTDMNAVFPDPDVVLRCEDGSLNFSSSLLRSVPYFEAFYRWNGQSIREIALTGVPLEIASVFVRFLIAHTIEDTYSLIFEQLLKLFVFADRYGLDDLADDVLDLLELELNVDELVDMGHFVAIFTCTRLDAVLVDFLVDHLPFVIDSDPILASLPERIIFKLNDKLAENFRTHLDKSQDPVNPAVQSTFGDLSRRFISASMEYLKSLNAEMDPLEFARFLTKRQRQSTQKKTSVSDKAPLLFRLSESSIHEEPIPSTKEDSISQILPPNQTPMDIPAPIQAKSPWKRVSDQTVEVPKMEQLLREENNNFLNKSIPPKNGQCPIDAEHFEKSLNLSWASSFSPNSPPSISLSQVMEDERRRQQALRQKQRTPIKTPEVVKQPRRLSWAQTNQDQPRIPARSLSEIQEAEAISEAAASIQRPCKSVHAVELEEQAMQELEQYYNALYEEGEVQIVVRREPKKEEQNKAPEMSPSWKPTRYRQKDV